MLANFLLCSTHQCVYTNTKEKKTLRVLNTNVGLSRSRMFDMLRDVFECYWLIYSIYTGRFYFFPKAK